MHVSFAMHIIYSLQNLPHVYPGLMLWKIPIRILLDFRIKLTSWNNLNYHIVPILVFEILVHFYDVRVVQRFVDFYLVF